MLYIARSVILFIANITGFKVCVVVYLLLMRAIRVCVRYKISIELCYDLSEQSGRIDDIDSYISTL